MGVWRFSVPTSRFLSQAPWSADALAQTWLTRFHAQLALLV